MQIGFNSSFGMKDQYKTNSIEDDENTKKMAYMNFNNLNMPSSIFDFSGDKDVRPEDASAVRG